MRLVDLDDLISIENVSALTGTSNPTVVRMVRDGQLPEPIRIAPRCVMFSRTAVRQALGLLNDPLSSEMMSAPATAALLGVSIHKLRAMENAGEGPPVHRRGGRGVRYMRTEVLAYLQNQRPESESLVSRPRSLVPLGMAGLRHSQEFVGVLISRAGH